MKKKKENSKNSSFKKIHKHLKDFMLDEDGFASKAASIVTYLPAGYAAVGVADSTFYVQEPAKVVNPLVAGGAEIMDSILPVEGYIIATKE